MLRHNFYQSDGRLVKLFLFSTLLDKSPLTSIYFATFEKGSQVSPTHTTNFLVFGKFHLFWLYEYLYLGIIMHLILTDLARISKITTRQTRNVCKCGE